MSKPDGEYTIAYTYPIEANTQTQALAALENIKVGNTTYSVPLPPMIVEGTFDGEHMKFIPNSGSPSVLETIDLLKNGGIVYLKTEQFMSVASWISDSGIEAIFATILGGEPCYWMVPIIVYGTVGSDPSNPETRVFMENAGQISSSDAKQDLSHEFQIALSYEISGETIVDNIVGYSSDFHALYTERDVLWYDSSIPDVG